MLIVSVMPIIIFAQRGLTQRPAPLWLPLLLLNYTTWPPEVKRIFQILFPWIGPVFASRVFAGLLASCWRPAGILLASCWHPAGILLASCWRPAGVLLASCWRPAEHPGNQESNHTGNPPRHSEGNLADSRPDSGYMVHSPTILAMPS